MIHSLDLIERGSLTCANPQAHLHGDRGDCHTTTLCYQYNILNRVLRYVYLFSVTRRPLLNISFPKDLSFVISVRFVWKVAVIVAVSAFPLYVIKFIKGKISPAASSKLL